MGYYIETPEPLKKAKQIVDIYGAELVLSPESFPLNGSKALICVVENGPFDAAGVAYDKHERDTFMEPDDPRPKTWLSLPKSKVLELCPNLKLERTFIP